MPFPQTDRAIYERNPLTEVICQLRYPTILRIASEPPAELQERLRNQYPVFREKQGGQPRMPQEVSRILADLPVQLPTEPTIYAFETEDGSRTINLSREFVAVTERDYRHWESFRGEVERVKQAVEEIYKPPFYNRTGLRYQDVIDRETLELQDVSWNELVQTPMAGLLGSPDDSVRDHIREAVSTAELEIPEVNGGTVRLQYGLATREDDQAQVYAMDADFYTQERSSTDDVFPILDAFNGHAGNFFRWSITDRLRDALRPRGDGDAGDVGNE
jgi:uncharacterized protein (TIGR04255 family)